MVLTDNWEKYVQEQQQERITHAGAGEACSTYYRNERRE
jgi:hypothetical protein